MQDGCSTVNKYKEMLTWTHKLMKIFTCKVRTAKNVFVPIKGLQPENDLRISCLIDAIEKLPEINTFRARKITISSKLLIR